jgi:cbb3-type cytochrome oxidase subunit 3
MRDSDQRPGVKVTGLLQLGLFFAAVSAAVAAGGADDLIWASPRNVSEGITFCGFSLLGFCVAGRMVWTYRRMRKGHGLTDRALANLALVDDPDRPKRMRLLYIGLAAGAAGAEAAYQGRQILAGSRPDGTSVGAAAVTVAVICFLVAGYFWWQYRKERSRAKRDQP